MKSAKREKNKAQHRPNAIFEACVLAAWRKTLHGFGYVCGFGRISWISVCFSCLDDSFSWCIWMCLAAFVCICMFWCARLQHNAYFNIPIFTLCLLFCICNSFILSASRNRTRAKEIRNKYRRMNECEKEKKATNQFYFSFCLFIPAIGFVPFQFIYFVYVYFRLCNGNHP